MKRLNMVETWVTIIAGILAVAGISCWGIYQHLQPVSVPYVMGMSVVDAQNMLSEHGLSGNISGEGDTVIAQDPEGGAEIKRGSAVSLTTEPEAVPVQKEDSLDDYSWQELAEASRRISAAPSDEDAISIAETYGLCGSDGRLDGSQQKSVGLSDGTEAHVRVLGFRHDTATDGGAVGITWGFSGVIATHQYTDGDSLDGGWKKSSLRRYMNGDLFEKLPDDLKAEVKWVEKATNNVGETDAVEKTVTTTRDRLWPLSAREVYGDITWWQGSSQELYDGIYNAEGEQYQLFADAGLNSDTKTSDLLRLGGVSDDWWLRSPNPYANDSFKNHAIFVDADGYKNGDGPCATERGVMPCFCI